MTTATSTTRQTMLIVDDPPENPITSSNQSSPSRHHAGADSGHFPKQRVTRFRGYDGKARQAKVLLTQEQ